MSGSDWTIITRTAAITAALISLEIISFPPLTSGWARSRPGSAGCIDGARGLDGLHLVGPEVEEPAVVALQLGGGIVVRAYGKVQLAVDVMQDRLHRRLAPDQEQVLGVGAAGTRPHADPAARGDPDAGHDHVVGFRRYRAVGTGIPPWHGWPVRAVRGRLRQRQPGRRAERRHRVRGRLRPGQPGRRAERGHRVRGRPGVAL